MAKILHIETATKACSVGVSENGELVTIKEELSAEFTHAENITLFIDEVVKKAGWTLNQLDAIAVTSGPGSYTGLRIGVSTAKGLCYALEKPLIAVDALISLAAQATLKHPGKTICAAIDARRMEVFSAIYESHLTPLKKISADIIEADTYFAFEPFVICGDGAEKLKIIWENRAVEFDTTIYSSVSGQVKIAYEKFQASEFEDVAYFEPFYLKDFVGNKS
jgi:tRNA threonylcarbamoyladenosine biosynthesis protein TsaB